MPQSGQKNPIPKGLRKGRAYKTGGYTRIEVWDTPGLREVLASRLPRIREEGVRDWLKQLYIYGRSVYELQGEQPAELCGRTSASIYDQAARWVRQILSENFVWYIGNSSRIRIMSPALDDMVYARIIRWESSHAFRRRTEIAPARVRRLHEDSSMLFRWENLDEKFYR